MVPQHVYDEALAKIAELEAELDEEREVVGAVRKAAENSPKMMARWEPCPGNTVYDRVVLVDTILAILAKYRKEGDNG